MEKELTFEGGQSTITPLTPNSNAIAVSSGYRNDDTQVVFMVIGAPYWAALVSSATTIVINDQDRGNGIVIFTEGLTVEFLPLWGGYYNVTVTGIIEDSANRYRLEGKSLGIFT